MRPGQCEVILNGYEDRVIDWLMSKGRRTQLLFALFGLPLFGFMVPIFSELRLRFLHYPNVQSASLTVVLLIGFSAPMLLFAEKGRKYYSVLCFVLGWIFQVHVGYGPEPPLTVLLLLPILAVFSWLVLLKARPRWSISLSYFFSVFVLAGLVIRLAPHTGGWLINVKFHYYAIGVVALLMSQFPQEQSEKLRFAMSPAHLVLPVVFPLPDGINQYRRSDSRVWCSGLVQVTKGFFLVFLASFIFKGTVGSSGVGMGRRVFGLYLIYLLIAPAVANIITGVGRLYYLNIPDCSNHLWLASSPLDFLKRDNVHAYKFSIRFVYFNVLRFTRNPLVVAIVYCLLFPFYRNSFDYAVTPTVFSWSGFIFHFASGFVFWGLVLVAIGATYRLTFFRSQGERWRPVLATHGIMLCCVGGYALWISRG